MTMIDRDELLKKIAPMSLSNGSVLGRHSGTADVIAEMVQNAPAIDPESLRGHAKWVKDKELKFIIVDDENNSHEEPAICCTHCKAKISQSDFDSWVWNFCPVMRKLTREHWRTAQDRVAESYKDRFGKCIGEKCMAYENGRCKRLEREGTQ